jgi:hypothetical protein
MPVPRYKSDTSCLGCLQKRLNGDCDDGCLPESFLDVGPAFFAMGGVLPCIARVFRFESQLKTLKAFEEGKVRLEDGNASVTLSSDHANVNEWLYVGVYCEELDWQLSFLEQICTSSLPPLSTLHDLYMTSEDPWPQDWKDNIDCAQWLELLRSFTAVKNIYLSRGLASCVVPALQDLVDGRTTGAFPALQNIFVEELEESGPVQEALGKFVAARQVTSHPIMVSRWDRN